MSAYGFMWDAIQSGQIGNHDDRIEELEKKVEILKEWVDYLNNQLKEKENVTSSTGLQD